MSKHFDFTQAAPPPVVRAFRQLEQPIPKDPLSQSRYKVLMPYFDWMQWSTYVKKAPGEISVLGYVDIIDRTTFFVTDFYMPIQKNTGTSTDMDEDDLAKYFTLEQQAGKDTSKKRNWTHSHAGMAPFWSGTDENCIKTLGRSWENYVLSLVTNKRNEYKARLDVFDPVQLSFDNIPLELVMDDRGIPNVEQIALWEKEVDEKSRPLYSTNYGYGWDREGGEWNSHSGFRETESTKDWIFNPATRIWERKKEGEAGATYTGRGDSTGDPAAERRIRIDQDIKRSTGPLTQNPPGGFPSRPEGDQFSGYSDVMLFETAFDAEQFIDDATATQTFFQENVWTIEALLTEEEVRKLTMNEIIDLIIFRAQIMKDKLEEQESNQGNLFEDDPRKTGISGASIDFTSPSKMDFSSAKKGQIVPMPPERGMWDGLEAMYD